MFHITYIIDTKHDNNNYISIVLLHVSLNFYCQGLFSEWETVFTMEIICFVCWEFFPFWYSGVPGVKTERFEEGMKIRHCALSLVGEQWFLWGKNILCILMEANRVQWVWIEASLLLRGYNVCCFVGEPIMYPRINELIKILHGHEISSFLVTNAQFPDAIRLVFLQYWSIFS